MMARMRAVPALLWIVAGLAALAPATVAVPTATALPAATKAECPVPGYLLVTDSRLDKVAAAVSRERRLDILVVGSLSSALPGAGGAAYPARLGAALEARLPGVAVTVAVEILSKTPAEQVVPRLAGFIATHRPVLTVWQAGTTDAIRAVAPEDFRDALEEGVAALRQAGGEVLLVNPQYSPQLETMVSLTPYLDGMRIVAQHEEVPLFDRFAVMRHWNDVGAFDLSDPAGGLDLARAVHDCLGRALATFILEAARIDPASLRARP